MEKEDFKERCSNLFDFFDGGEIEDPETELKDIRLFSFLRNLKRDTYEALSTYLQEKNQKIGDTWARDLFEEFWADLVECSFAVGFAFGNLIEPTDPAILNDLDFIKKAIREKQLLPYLPREKKA